MTTALKAGSFYGETINMRAVDAVLSEVRHDHGRSVPAHTHEYAYFSLLLEGSYRETSSESTIVYDPFTVVFHAARMVHTDIIGTTGGCFFMVELGPRWMEMIAEGRSLPEHIVELRGGHTAWLMFRLYQEFLTRGATTELSIESLLYELCASVSGAPALPAQEPPWMAKVDGAIQDGFTSTVLLADIASAAGVHPSHLCRAFHRFRGRSLGDYVIGLRMQFAYRRMVETAKRLSEIAAEAGFSDQSHMTNIFKRLTGVTPAAYRRRLRVSIETGGNRRPRKRSDRP